MGGHHSKKERIINHLTSKDRDLVYSVYEKKKFFDTLTDEELKRYEVFKKIAGNLKRPEFLKPTVDLLKCVSKRHYKGIIKHCIPKFISLDVFSLKKSISRRLFSNADLVEDILIVFNTILLHHTHKLTQTEAIVLLGFLKNYVIGPFPRFHFRRTQILCRVYVGLQCISAIAFPYSVVQEYCWSTLNILLQSMNLMLIETVIFIQNGKFESLVLEYRNQKINEVKGELACQCLFKLSRYVIEQYVEEEKMKEKEIVGQCTKKEEEEEGEGEEEVGEDEEEDMLRVYDLLSQTSVDQRRIRREPGTRPMREKRALVDWAIRSVIRIFENPSIFGVLNDVGWVDSLVEIVLMSGKGRTDYVMRGMERIRSLVDHSPKYEFSIRKLFFQKRQKNLEEILSRYDEYSKLKEEVNGLRIKAKKKRMKEIQEDLVALIGKDEYEGKFRADLLKKIGMGNKGRDGMEFCDLKVKCLFNRKAGNSRLVE